jgi:hypothetical protein
MVGAMSAAMRSGVIVEKFKTIEKNFVTTAAIAPGPA